MSDLIDRQTAIDAVKKNTFRLTFAEEQNCEGHLAWSANAVYSDVIEGALLELPSAQPETTERTTETAQNVSDRDLISRKAAIDAGAAGGVRMKLIHEEYIINKIKELQELAYFSFCYQTDYWKGAYDVLDELGQCIKEAPDIREEEKGEKNG